MSEDALDRDGRDVTEIDPALAEEDSAKNHSVSLGAPEPRLAKPGSNASATASKDWRPKLSPEGPRYRALADAIAEAVSNGVLKAGDKLPPVRDLAWDLKVTPGTVARAYHLAENRGLLKGQVGRGTFVRTLSQSPKPISDPAETVAPALLSAATLADGSPPLGALASPVVPANESPFAGEAPADLRTNRAVKVGQDKIITERLLSLVERHGALPLTEYRRFEEDAVERAAAARWLAKGGLPERTEDTLICSGAQHALLVAFAATSGGGDAVALTEPLIHPGTKDCARALGVRLEPVAADPELGLEPEAVDAAAARFRPSAIILSANHQNPTLATMPLERRMAIAEIARRRRIPVIEDDVYGWTGDERLPSFPDLIPDLCWYVSSLSKCVAAGLRAGFLLCPTSAGPLAARLLQGSTQHVSWLITALAAAMIDSGDADRIVGLVRAENEHRAETLERTLGPVVAQTGGRLRSSAQSSMAWLELPEPWRASDFERGAWKAGVGIITAEAFAVGRSPAPHAIRIAYGACGREALQIGAEKLAALLAAGPQCLDIRA